jgi:alpha 1,2-mannosyltransferase
MRYKLCVTRSVTRTITLIVLLYIILYLYEPDRVPTSLSKHIPSFDSSDGSLYLDQPTSETVSSAFYKSIQSFWASWSKIFHDGRPRTERILLGSNANIVSISSDDYGPREPPVNRVLNSESDVESLRSSHAALLETLQSEDIVGDMFNGTGIVIVGGGEYFGPAIIGLHMLRKTGSTLPVEIFVADASEYEPSLCEDYLPRFGARCLVLTHFLQDGNTSQSFEVTHYQLKSLSILFSSFAEVLYLDSDSIPLVDPLTKLFSTEPYKSSGLVIWPDFWVSTESPLFYTIAGLPTFPSDLPKSSSEAGQLLINKRTHLKTLLLAIYYNIYGPDYYYPLLSQGVLGQGDKETFLAAALVAGESYYRIKTRVIAIGRHDGQEFKGSGMIQHLPSDDLPAFLHANTPKMNAKHLVNEGDLFAVNQMRLRLWGSREDQEKSFGYDLEKAVWELLLKTGCELEQVIEEWKGPETMCRRLKEHWKEIFSSSRS